MVLAVRKKEEKDMDWLDTIRKALAYMEGHLWEDISAVNVSEEVYLSQVHFQKGFQVMTGFSVMEYIRNRRLYLAAIDIRDHGKKVIDAALDCGYETPESFTRAFTRFHEATPTEVRQGAPIKPFLPLTIKIDIQGGTMMEYKIRNLFGFKVIGFVKSFSGEDAHAGIPRFWDETCEKYAKNVYAGNPPANAYEKALMDNCIGEYGVCIDDESLAGKGRFLYMIAGRYTGGEVPEGMMLYEFPRGDWAIFDCVGAIPDALQSLNDRIFREWLPGNPDYEMCGNVNVEWYDCMNGEKSDPDYHSAVWIPVKKK